MGDDHGPLRRRQSGIGRAVPEAWSIDPAFFVGNVGGIIMNTAIARRLALGDRVIWMGKDSRQPSGPGTIIRITAHQVEVLWEGEIARRYRRAQLHNLRHEKLISAAAESRCTSQYVLESATYAGVCVAAPVGKHDRHIVVR
jgi:hypothetical protein